MARDGTRAACHPTAYGGSPRAPGYLPKLRLSIGPANKGFMIVRCSQCGAKINRKDENRFFSCPYCASALVLEGGRSFACFIMEHEQNDLWARALFHERLKQAGAAPDRGTVTVEFTYIPFWVIRRPDGSIAARPAAETHHRDLSSIKVPPGRLIFYEQDSRPDAPVIALSVPLNLAFNAEKKKTSATSILCTCRSIL